MTARVYDISLACHLNNHLNLVDNLDHPPLPPPRWRLLAEPLPHITPNHLHQPVTSRQLPGHQQEPGQQANLAETLMAPSSPSSPVVSWVLLKLKLPLVGDYSDQPATAKGHKETAAGTCCPIPKAARCVCGVMPACIACSTLGRTSALNTTPGKGSRLARGVTGI